MSCRASVPQYPVPAAEDHVEMRCVLLSTQPRLPCHVSAPARALVARLLTPEPRHRLNSLLKLSREAWFANYNLDAVKAREVSSAEAGLLRRGGWLPAWVVGSDVAMDPLRVSTSYSLGGLTPSRV